MVCDVCIQAKKRCRKTAEFWSAIAAKFSQSGEATEKLIKNLGTEYQRVKQQLMLSGAATETPVLRGSPELFAVYEAYYSLYYPQGGSTLPKIVLTESTIVQ